MSVRCTEPTSLHDPAPDRLLVLVLTPLRAPLARVPPVALPPTALAAATGALVALALGTRLLGGFLILLTALLDAAGALPSRCGQTAARRIAAVIDGVADRYADLCILGGLGAWSLAHEDGPAPLLVAFTALVGELALAYTCTRVQASVGATAAHRLFWWAGRDLRLLVAALAAVTGQVWWALVLLATVTHATVAWGLVRLRGSLSE
jgi:phosphatidylglycerophosphate synthase